MVPSVSGQRSVTGRVLNTLCFSRPACGFGAQIRCCPLEPKKRKQRTASCEERRRCRESSSASHAQSWVQWKISSQKESVLFPKVTVIQRVAGNVAHNVKGRRNFFIIWSWCRVCVTAGIAMLIVIKKKH